MYINWSCLVNTFMLKNAHPGFKKYSGDYVF